MTAGFETVPCPLCGSTRYTQRYSIPDSAYGTPGRFRMVTCDACGFLYLSPRPTQTAMNAHYPPGYEPFRKAIEDQTANRYLRWLRHMQLRTRCAQIYKLAAGGRLLDVGCSTGLFLNEMRRYGQWELAGIETDAGAAIYGRTRFELDIFTGQLEDAPWSDATFDVITLWDVLEHLPNPSRAVARLSALLQPSGRLVVSVPNLDSLDAHTFGPYWTGIDPPRHLSVFRAKDIRTLFDSAGLMVERMYSFYGRYTTFAASLRLVLQAHMRNHRVRRLLERLIELPVWRFATLPYFSLVDHLNKGAILTVVARRQERLQ